MICLFILQFLKKSAGARDGVSILITSCTIDDDVMESCIVGIEVETT